VPRNNGDDFLATYVSFYKHALQFPFVLSSAACPVTDACGRSNAGNNCDEYVCIKGLCGQPASQSAQQLLTLDPSLGVNP